MATIMITEEVRKGISEIDEVKHVPPALFPVWGPFY